MASNHQPWKEKNARIVHQAATAKQHSQADRLQSLDMMRTQAAELQRTQRDVQNKLALRIDEIDMRKGDLVLAIENSETEIAALTDYKLHVEQTIQDKERPLAVTRECQSLRKTRQQPDLIVDNVEDMLGQEAARLLQVQDRLKQKHSECAETLRRLRAACFQLREDFKDKSASHSIDAGCAQLDPAQPDLALFRDTVRISAFGEKAALPVAWEKFTAENIDNSAAEIAASVALREELDALFKATAAQLLALSNGVEDAFNGRLAEYNEAKSLASQHLARIQTEIAVQDRNVAELREALASREAPLKLATTRLERRQQRPNIELVRDGAETALVAEVGTLDMSVEQMQARLAQVEETLRGLLRSQLTLQGDIDCKTNSINIDNACMMSRQQLKYAPI